VSGKPRPKPTNRGCGDGVHAASPTYSRNDAYRHDPATACGVLCAPDPAEDCKAAEAAPPAPRGDAMARISKCGSGSVVVEADAERIREARIARIGPPNTLYWIN